MKEKVSPSILNHTLSFNPWVFFIIFLISNTLLSFYPCSLQFKLLIVLLGLIFPWVIGYKTISPQETKRPIGEDHFNPPFWLWLLLSALVLLTRFYHLATLPSWLLGDEGYESALGIGLLSHWDWRLLWSPVPHEPLLDWLLGLFFKLASPSLLSFRLFSAFISLATVGAAYWGSRPFVSRRVSFLFALVLAFSYWSFTLSRLGIVVILIPLIQCLAFGYLGRLIQAKSNSIRWRAWAGLTAANILGFYTWTNWIGPGLALCFILLIYFWKNQTLSKIYLWGFYLVSALAVIPLVLARLAPGGMAHIGEIYHFNLVKPFLYYLIVIFWDGSAAANYASLWGGFFNPIVSSLSLLGIILFFQQKDSFWRWTLPAAVFISFVPALLASGDVEPYRSLPVMLFLTLAAVNGAQGLFRLNSQKFNSLAVLLLLTTSAGMDIYNYAAIYCNADQLSIKMEWRSKAYQQAYQILDQ
ncbi:MAG TPA: glycosyltransferase family 39 protein, partial [bacterium]|nr:glycosyltransferase family 39 protein [bacterium]